MEALEFLEVLEQVLEQVLDQILEQVLGQVLEQVHAHQHVCGVMTPLVGVQGGGT